MTTRTWTTVPVPRRGMLWLLACLPIVASSTAHGDGGKGFYQGDGNYQLAPRSALVVGVSQLKEGGGFTSLKNPANDANRVADALRDAGFSVTNLNDAYGDGRELTRQNIKKAVYDFAVLLRAIGGVGLVYFSGHGLERAGRTYLVPADAYVRFDRDFEEELIPLDFFYDAFAYAGNPLNLVIVDACRDDPWKMPLGTFGTPPAFEAHVASPNVIRVSSTLSGNKALDGTGALSPFAAMFVAALIGPAALQDYQASLGAASPVLFGDEARFDRSLSEFFDTMGSALHILATNNAAMDVPVVETLPGRDFIFSPSIVSFHREEQLFRSGQRELLQTLIHRYSGGYFYKAAKSYLDHAPLAPPPPPTALKVVELKAESNVRTGPSTGSEVVAVKASGDLLPVVSEPLRRSDGSWLPVRIPARNNVVFVRADRVKKVARKAQHVTIDCRFQPGPLEGTELLAAETAERVSQALTRDNPNVVTRVEIVGFKSAAANADEERVRVRQAAAIAAIKSAGYDPSRVAVVVRATNDDAMRDTVRIEING